MIKYFTIYGERCSGTNFLMHSLENNFDINFTSEYAWKHFFGHYDFDNLSEENNNETLFIGIIRNPIEWINSFYKNMHHIPIENKLNIRTFLFNTFYSVYGDNSEIIEDRNFLTKERYNNIFELRKVKNNFLINDMKNKVKNYILIRYEDLRDHYDNVLGFIQQKFKLVKKNDNYVKIDTYKGNNNRPFFIKPIKLPKRIIRRIKENVDKKQENSLGYM
jgi:hypothetical protein